MNAATIVAQPVTRLATEIAIGIGALLKRKEPRNDSLHRAIDHAIADIAIGRQAWLDGDEALVESSRTDGEFYRVGPDFCACETRRGVCRHKARRAILIAERQLDSLLVDCAPVSQDAEQPPVRVIRTRAAARRTRPTERWLPNADRVAQLKAARTQDDLEAACNWE